MPVVDVLTFLVHCVKGAGSCVDVIRMWISKGQVKVKLRMDVEGPIM